ncbi:hypothetical protein BH11PSE7_BH11PSE7_26240 [soil metagenome]
MNRVLLLWVIAIALALCAPAQAAEKFTTRAQALKAVDDPDPGIRMLAIERLAAIGTMADANRLADHLDDEAAPVRQYAEMALLQIWSRSGDRAVDALYLRGVQQMQAGNLQEALATFNAVVQKRPAFAEGWNKRATIYYLLGQYEASMKDCDEVLKRNSKHFGALAGYGQMYAAQGDYAHAVPFLERALQVNPNLPGVLQTLQIIREELEERQRSTI